MEKKRKRKIDRRLILFIRALIVIILIVACVYTIYTIAENRQTEPQQDYPMKVGFIDVGQGDCIFIECEGKTVLIDGGEKECAKTVVDFIKAKNITDIDCYVATHPHSDHIGAAPQIFAELNVKSVIMTTFSEINIPTTVTYEDFLTAVKNERCEVYCVTAGDVYTYGNLALNILSPYEESEEYNNMSVVIKAVYNKTSFLLTGDAEKAAENIMLEHGADLKADVLKIGHHGSSSSTGEAFLKAVSPLAAVISVGENNIYDHPSDETIKLLNNSGITFYRTDKDGTVVICSDGDNVYTEK